MLTLRRVGHGGQGTTPAGGAGAVVKQEFAAYMTRGSVRHDETPPRRSPPLTPIRGRVCPLQHESGVFIRHDGSSSGCMATALKTAFPRR